MTVLSYGFMNRFEDLQVNSWVFSVLYKLSRWPSVAFMGTSLIVLPP